ncbi:QacE family quaternary ammonium compound efflux SMR transporter [Campylobacter sp. MIT 12-8780]|uniref:DMT family transporter n=1 Tax=unclassified Campylobacter TaxID=2593542 RepID=UPI00115CF308|nr:MULTISPECIES: multidrug efflux SMR transporter [unclassified Campylobacter]NDJ26817.1 multidrug efflux SMR transporter [Campylobacter sp. MIT 19-121]TQR42362.1 QacE family quaternary ammonium compound efflux SMR transporter [Campylobacter sp. MIT 12-8780]
MSWFCLILAGCIEILGVIAMKKHIQSGKKIYFLAIVILFMCSFGFLSLAMREISAGTAYAIWTGIGAGGGVIVGVLFFKESKNALKLVFVGLILLCSVGLKLVSH